MGYLAQFNNYTSNQSLNSCFNYVYRRYIKYRFGTNINILENMICENKSLSFRYLYIPLEFHIIHRRCPRGMQVNNVTLNSTYYYREKHLECFCGKFLTKKFEKKRLCTLLMNALHVCHINHKTNNIFLIVWVFLLYTYLVCLVSLRILEIQPIALETFCKSYLSQQKLKPNRFH